MDLLPGLYTDLMRIHTLREHARAVMVIEMHTDTLTAPIFFTSSWNLLHTFC